MIALLLIAAMLVWSDEDSCKPCKWIYLPQSGKLYYLSVGELVYLTQLNAKGEFEAIFGRAPISKWELRLGGAIRLAPRTDTADGRCFEYRSGILIPGQVIGQVFVPRSGTCISTFDDYLRGYGPRSDPIYNLPGEVVPCRATDSSGFQLPRSAKVPPPRIVSSTNRCGRGYRPFPYVFVQDLTPRIHHKWGEKVYVGNLDTYGRFIPDPLVPPQEPEKFAGIVPNSRPLMLGPDGRREVYEFRAGRLVPGKLTDDDRFVPQVGGLIIHIRDYVYTPEARPIYNLPGRFYPKGMKINVAGRDVPVEKIGNRWDLYPP